MENHGVPAGCQGASLPIGKWKAKEEVDLVRENEAPARLPTLVAPVTRTKTMESLKDIDTKPTVL